MRKGPIVLVVVAFALFFAWKGRPFLHHGPPEIASTPTIQPSNAAELGEVPLKRGRRACLDKIEYGPDARYVLVTVLTSQPTGRLRFEARAPGYAADALAPAGAGDNQQVVVPIKPAPRPIDNGTLCIINQASRAVGFYSVGSLGPQGTPSQTTVDGKPIDLDLSVTLLTNRSASFSSRLGTLFDHMASFNPLSGWTVWALFVLTLLGVPLAIGAALGRAVAEDADADADAAARSGGTPPRGGS